MKNSNVSQGNFAIDKVDVNLDMLPSLMLNGISRKVYDVDIITVD